MSLILCRWLNEEVSLSKHVENETMARDFASGYLFGELLSKSNLQPDFKSFMNSSLSEHKLNNFLKLEPTFRRLKLTFDANLIAEIMQERAGAASKVVYQLFVVLQKLEQILASTSLTDTWTTSSAFEDALRQRTLRQTDLDLLGVQDRFHLKQRAQEDAAMRAQQAAEARLQAQRAKQHKDILERSRELKRQYDEKIKAFAENPPPRYIPAKSTKTLPSLPPMTSTQLHEPQEAPLPQTATSDSDTLRKTRRGAEDALFRERERRTRMFLVAAQSKQEALQSAHMGALLTAKLHRRSAHQQRLASELQHTWRELDTMRANRDFVDAQLRAREEQDALEARALEAHLASLHKHETEAQLQVELQRWRRARAMQTWNLGKENFDFCREIVSEMIVLALNMAEYRLKTRNNVPDALSSAWNSVFITGLPLVTTDPKICEEKERSLDEHEFEEYNAVSGGWHVEPEVMQVDSSTQTTVVPSVPVSSILMPGPNMVLQHVINRVTQLAGVVPQHVSEPSHPALPDETPDAQDQAMPVPPPKEEVEMDVVVAVPSVVFEPVTPPPPPRVRGVVIGPPFSGKTSTLSALELSLHVTTFHPETLIKAAVDIFLENNEEARDDPTEREKVRLGGLLHAAMVEGEAVPDDTLIALIRVAILSLPIGQGWLLDGFPTTPHQAALLETMVTHLYFPQQPKARMPAIMVPPTKAPFPPEPEALGLNTVIIFDCASDVVIPRASSRRPDGHVQPLLDGCYDEAQLHARYLAYLAGQQDILSVLSLTATSYRVDGSQSKDSSVAQVVSILNDVMSLEHRQLELDMDTQLEADVVVCEAETNLWDETQAHVGVEETMRRSVVAMREEQERLQREEEEKERALLESQGGKKKPAKKPAKPGKPPKGPSVEELEGAFQQQSGPGDNPPPASAPTQAPLSRASSPQKDARPMTSMSMGGPSSRVATAVPPDTEGPVPGDEDYEFLDLTLDPSLTPSLNLMWPALEANYISSVKPSFALLRNEWKLVVNYLYGMEVEYERFLHRVDHKQEFVARWQADHNSFAPDLREDMDVVCELHQRVEDLKTTLVDICHTRNEEAQKEATSLRQNSWIERTIAAIFNYFIALLQAEIDRAQLTQQLLDDYYSNQKNDIIPARAPRVVLPLLDLLMGPSETKGAVPYPYPPPASLPDAPPPTAAGKDKGKPAAKDKPKGKEPEKKEDRPVDAETPLPLSVYLTPEGVLYMTRETAGAPGIVPEDELQTFVHMAQRVVSRAYVPRESPDAKRQKKFLEEEKKREEEAAKAAPPKKGKTSKTPAVVDRPPDPTPEELEAAEKKAAREELCNRLDAELYVASENENNRLAARSSLVVQHLMRYLRDFQSRCASAFGTMEHISQIRFQKELSCVDALVQQAHLAVEERRPFLPYIALKDDVFVLDNKLYVSAAAPPLVPPPPVETMEEDAFTTKQLRELIVQFSLIAPEGYLSLNDFVAIVGELHSDSSLFPPSWSLLGHDEVLSLCVSQCGESLHGDWRVFLLACAGLLPASFSAIAAVYSFLMERGAGSRVGWDDFQRAPWWFVDPEPDERSFDRGRHLVSVVFQIFEMQTGSVDPTTLALSFCFDGVGSEGFLKSLCLLSGQAYHPLGAGSIDLESTDSDSRQGLSFTAAHLHRSLQYTRLYRGSTDELCLESIEGMVNRASESENLSYPLLMASPWLAAFRALTLRTYTISPFFLD